MPELSVLSEHVNLAKVLDLVGLEVQHFEFFQVAHIVQVINFVVTGIQLSQIINSNNTTKILELTPRNVEDLDPSKGCAEVSH